MEISEDSESYNSVEIDINLSLDEESGDDKRNSNAYLNQNRDTDKNQNLKRTPKKTDKNKTKKDEKVSQFNSKKPENETNLQDRSSPLKLMNNFKGFFNRSASLKVQNNKLSKTDNENRHEQSTNNKIEQAYPFVNPFKPSGRIAEKKIIIPPQQNDELEEEIENLSISETPKREANNIESKQVIFQQGIIELINTMNPSINPEDRNRNQVKNHTNEGYEDLPINTKKITEQTTINNINLSNDLSNDNSSDIQKLISMKFMNNSYSKSLSMTKATEKSREEQDVEIPENIQNIIFKKRDQIRRCSTLIRRDNNYINEKNEDEIESNTISPNISALETNHANNNNSSVNSPQKEENISIIDKELNTKIEDLKMTKHQNIQVMNDDFDNERKIEIQKQSEKDQAAKSDNTVESDNAFESDHAFESDPDFETDHALDSDHAVERDHANESEEDFDADEENDQIVELGVEEDYDGLFLKEMLLETNKQFVKNKQTSEEKIKDASAIIMFDIISLKIKSQNIYSFLKIQSYNKLKIKDYKFRLINCFKIFLFRRKEILRTYLRRYKTIINHKYSEQKNSVSIKFDFDLNEFHVDGDLEKLTNNAHIIKALYDKINLCLNNKDIPITLESKKIEEIKNSNNVKNVIKINSETPNLTIKEYSNLQFQGVKSTTAVPNIPNIPQKPGIPNVPQVPGIPNIPQVPGISKIPTVPGIPNTPQVPGISKIPTVPGIPNIPQVPGISKIPTVPGIPNTPQVPGISKIPTVPGIPNIPQVPGIPNIPQVPGISKIPTVPGIPNIPINSIPKIPGVPGIPSIPGLPTIPGIPNIAKVASIPSNIPVLPGKNGIPTMPNGLNMNPNQVSIVNIQPKPPADTNPKKLFWNIIAKNKIAETFWVKENLEAKVDYDGLCKYFCESKKKEEKKENKDENKKPENNNSQVKILDDKRLMNLSIALTKVTLSHDELKEAIENFQNEKLPLEMIEKIISLAPNSEEIEKLKGFTGDQNLISNGERFCMTLMNIHKFMNKLECLKYKNVIEIEQEEIITKLKILNEGLISIKDSNLFKTVMKLILNIGNYLNSGTAKGNAQGVLMNTLPMLESVKGLGKEKYTLLDFLILNIKSKESSLINFYKDFSDLESVLKVDIADTEAKIKEFENGLKKLKKEKEALEKEQNKELVKCFYNFTNELELNASDKFDEILKAQEKLNTLIHQTAVYFGEDPKQFKVGDFLKMINDFVENFKKISSKMSAEEAKQLKKQIQTEKNKKDDNKNKYAKNLEQIRKTVVRKTAARKTAARKTALMKNMNLNKEKLGEILKNSTAKSENSSPNNIIKLQRITNTTHNEENSILDKLGKLGKKETKKNSKSPLINKNSQNMCKINFLIPETTKEKKETVNKPPRISKARITKFKNSRNDDSVSDENEDCNEVDNDFLMINQPLKINKLSNLNGMHRNLFNSNVEDTIKEEHFKIKRENLLMHQREKFN